MNRFCFPENDPVLLNKIFVFGKLLFKIAFAEFFGKSYGSFKIKAEAEFLKDHCGGSVF